MSVLNKGLGERYRLGYPWLLALIGSTVILSFVYSTFYPYLMEYFGVAEKAPFALGASVLGLANMLIAPPLLGPVLDKYGPKATLSIAAICLILGGLCMTKMMSYVDWAQAKTWWLIGSFCFGFAAGSFASTHVSTSSKWMPDKLGLASGIANIGPAIGAFWMAPVVAKLAPSIGIASTFWVFVAIGCAFAIILGVVFLRLPEPGWKPSGWNPPARKEVAGYSFSEALKTKQYWMIFCCILFAGTAGFLFAMNIATLIIEGCATIGGMDPGLVVATVVTVAVSATAVINAIARPCWGIVLQKLGSCWKTLIIIYVGFLLSLILFRFLYTGATSAIVAACIVYCFFGGTAVVHMGACSTLFGTKDLGKILGSTQIATGIGWGIGPYLGAWLADTTGTYAAALYTAVGLLVVAIILAFVMMSSSKKKVDAE